ncbi:MAG: type II toxin-antitoxin system HicB family antitoxin [Parvibaculaceae bacterium]
MRYYIAVVHKDEDSSFGAHFPDLPGCFSAADTLDEVVPKAAEAIALYAEDAPLPEPRSLDALRKDQDVATQLADGAMLVAVPHIENDARVERANITMEAGLLRAVDATAKARNLTRSAFLAQAARREIER